MPDTLQKIGKKLFLTRFKAILNNRTILPHSQSSFCEGWRLQTRVQLFLEDLMGQMANSALVATTFVDFQNAFDMLWHEGCVGKLARIGVPNSYTGWIRVWLENRRVYTEIEKAKYRWFHVEKGGAQGGILTPSLFIAYHANMLEFLYYQPTNCSKTKALWSSHAIGVPASKLTMNVESWHGRRSINI